MFPLSLLAAAAVLQPAMDHRQHAAGGPAAQPREGGQAAFSALGEAVALLQADPATDWSKVDLERLRLHLIDMDRVTMGARQEVERLPDGARFTVRGADAATVAAVKRMAAGHFTTENLPAGWTMTSTPTADGVVVTATAASPTDAAKIRALGFVGLLTLGSHHQPHHMMMARGQGRH